MQEQLTHLRDLVVRHAEGRRTETPISRLTLHMTEQTTTPVAGVFQASHCLVLQGAKEVMIGERKFSYDPASYFIASMELPAMGCITQASPERPYIGVTMRLDREALASLLAELPAQAETQAAGFAVSAVTPELLDAWARLLKLLDAPQDRAVLAPLIEREILYRLLSGPQGATLRQIALADSRLARVRRAIGAIRERYDQPLRVEALAELAGMSPASFHRHFKAATAMSPLQFQKHLRLQQARRLLIGEKDAARAGYAVGYESASQFSREYARLFGTPPARDAARLRGDDAALAEIADAA